MKVPPSIFQAAVAEAREFSAFLGDPERRASEEWNQILERRQVFLRWLQERSKDPECDFSLRDLLNFVDKCDFNPAARDQAVAERPWEMDRPPEDRIRQVPINTGIPQADITPLPATSLEIPTVSTMEQAA